MESTKNALTKASFPTRRVYSERMLEYGSIDKEFAVFEADIGGSTFSNIFGKAFPERYFNMGIAELGMVSTAAGMAAGGRNVVASTYGIFLTTRAVEAMRSMICYPNLPVKFLGSHGGLTAAIDGVTHQATEDIAFLTTLPNMKVLVPSDTNSARKLFDISMQTPGPCYTRLFRDAYYDLYNDDTEFHIGGSHIVKEGPDITIATYGDMIFQVLQAAEELGTAGINVEIIDLYSVKPLDYEGLKKSVAKTKKLFMVENHQKRNGIGYEIADYLTQNDIYIPYRHIGLDDTFAESGHYLDILNKYGLDAGAVVSGVKEMMK